MTENDVLAIRKSDDLYKTLAKKYKVHKNTIERIINRKSWTHI